MTIFASKSMQADADRDDTEHIKSAHNGCCHQWTVGINTVLAKKDLGRLLCCVVRGSITENDRVHTRSVPWFIEQICFDGGFKVRFKSFEIKNFKGIQRARIEFEPGSGNKIFTLVGLNESGKTTLLEAIHSFSPDKDNQIIFSDLSFAKQDKADLIPKHRLSNFSDSISVEATVALEEDDVSLLKAYVETKLSLNLDTSQLPPQFTIDYQLIYSASQYESALTTWNIHFYIKEKGKRNLTQCSDENWQSIVSFLQERFPSIAYFPTFVFDFPNKIYLSGKTNDKKSLFYRRVFQDILDFQGEDLKIDDHIVSRVRRSDLPSNPLEFIARILGAGSTVKQQIDHVMFKASAAVSKVIFDKWNEIFRDKVNRKEIIIEWQPEVDESGEKHVFIQFFIKDGATKYAVSERSLGFRWFFCFLLFTQFRASRREQARGTLFIFDEPASNLHSRAQEQLLESFPKISTGSNFLIYSTHSHYMINPHWLEQTYIVENRAISYDADEFELARNEKHTDIVATRYRRFVGENPDKSTYFQPILDKLDYAPSRMDLPKAAILLEGKSDFYILCYHDFIKIDRVSNCYVPSSGANDLGPLIALYLGWGRPFIIMLDGDEAGSRAKKKYLDEFGLPENAIILCPEAANNRKIIDIEDALDASDIELIKTHFGLTGRPSKKSVMRFFQEKLSSRERVFLSDKFLASVGTISQTLRKRAGID